MSREETFLLYLLKCSNMAISCQQGEVVEDVDGQTTQLAIESVRGERWSVQEQLREAFTV